MDQDKQFRRRFTKINDFKKVFNTPEGQKVLLEICRFCHVYNTCFDIDPYKLSYFNGQRDVAMWIMDLLKTDLQQFVKQYEEAKKDVNRDY